MRNALRFIRQRSFARAGLRRLFLLSVSCALVMALRVVSAHDVINLVGAFGFSENAGTSTLDASGINQPGVLKNGATWAAGKFGSGVSFDGVDDFLSIPDSAGLHLGATGTVEAWVKLNTLNRWNGVLGKATSSADESHNYAIEIDTANRPECVIGNGATINTARSTTALKANQWNHLACTWDGTQLKFYLNGVLNKTSTQTITPAFNTAPLVIGQYGGSVDWLNGTIDEVRVYNIAVSAANIVVDMNAAIQSTPDTTPPVVAITAPAEAAAVSASVAIVASASDDRVVAGVQFYIDGIALGAEDTASPYSMTWDTTTVGNGTHTITAIARDAAGNKATSTPRSVTVGNPPRLGITQPTAGASLTGGTLDITYVVLGDPTGYPVNHVHFQIDGGPEIMDLPPIDGVKTITDVPPGTHTLTGFLVRSDHTKIAGTDSAPVNFVMVAPDSIPPTVAITSPADGSVVTGVVTIAASASDNIGVAGVLFQVDGVNVGVEDTTAPYSVQWPAVGGGTHVVRAIARDFAGNTTTSAPINIVVATAGDPAVIGQWSALMNWPLVAVHSALMPTGEILMWDGWELPGAAAKVWDPATNTWYSTPVGAGVFCAAQVSLPDGRVFVIGGHAGGEIGIPDTFIFDPFTRGWTRTPYMNASRWYPSATRLGDGRVVAISGQIVSGSWADIPEIFNFTTNTWTNLTGASAANMHDTEYPLSFLMPDGRIYSISAMLGQAHYMSVSPQSWSASINTPMANGSASMYRPGKILMTGGGVVGPNNPTKTNTSVVDLTAPSPTWRSTAPMTYGRYEHNLVVLADGDVLAVGGSDKVTTLAENGPLVPELWKVATESWTSMAAMQNPRMYHSTAMLLPDGRVLAAGGGRLGSIPSYPTAEIFSPPYLFRGARPTITGTVAPAALGDTMTINTPDAANISRVALVPLGSVTHTLNMNQTYVELPFTVVGSSLRAQVTTNANVLPPGYYMLFILNGSGVPSVAPFVRILDPATANDGIGPTLAITNPVAGQSVAGTISITADASDNSGTVSSVQFQIDGQNLNAADTTPPFSTVWNTGQFVDGAHTVGAIARDPAGNVTMTSISVNVSNGLGTGSYLGHTTTGTFGDQGQANYINAWRFTMPNETGTAVSLSAFVGSPISPAPNNMFQAAIYSDQNGAPGALIATTAGQALAADAWNTASISATLQPNTPYWLGYNTNGASAAMNNVRLDVGVPGQMAWQSQPYGNWPATFGTPQGGAGNQGSIFVSYLTNGAPGDTINPTVSIAAPAAGATVSGTVTLSANATDNVAVANVQFKVDGVNVGAAVATAPYSTSWNTTAVAGGTHTITAVARDTAGNTATSAGVTVTVANGTATTKTLGYNTIGGEVDFGDANYMNAWKFSMPAETGTAQSLSVFVAGPVGAAPNNQFQVAVYADAGGVPGALIATSPATAIVADQWNTVPISAALQANTAYWLAYNTNASSGANNNVRLDTGAARQMVWRQQAFGSWPAMFGSTTGSSAARASIYVTYRVP